MRRPRDWYQRRLARGMELTADTQRRIENENLTPDALIAKIQSYQLKASPGTQERQDLDGLLQDYTSQPLASQRVIQYIEDRQRELASILEKYPYLK